MATEKRVLVPDIGDFDGVEVIEVLVAPGDRIEEETSLVTLESDKASMEIPSPFGGEVKEILVKVGDKVSEGSLLLTLTVDGQAETDSADPPQSETAPPPAPEDGSTDGAEAASEAQSAVVTKEVLVPDIGDFEGVEVIEVLVASGDQVEVDASLVTLESDKASMEIPSPYAGAVGDIAITVGDRVSEGTLLMTMMVDGASSTVSPQVAESVPQPPEVSAEEAESVQAPAPNPADGTRRAGEKESRRPPVLTRPTDTSGRKPHASPAVRRFARELGVPLAQVTGSGPKQRITKDDVQGFVKQALRDGGPGAATGPLQLPAVPSIDFSRFGEVEERPLSRIRKLSGTHLSASWLNVPHVTQFEEADITSLEAFRKEQKSAAAARDIKLTFLPFLMKACVGVLRELPDFNSSLSPDQSSLILKKYFHIGVAVDTPNGLVVPVVRDVDKKGILELAAELMDLSAKARAGKLLPGDMQGGCFSISSLGGIGGTAFTPIVNAPEVAILGVSRSETKPIWNGNEFLPRLMLPLSLSYDHRVIDGAQAARFTRVLSETLTDIRRLLL